MKKLLIMVLAVVLSMGVVLSGCGDVNETANNKKVDKTSDSDNDTIKELDFSVYTCHFGQSPKETPVQKKMWEMLEEYMGMKLNVEVEEIPYKDFGDRQTVYIASQEFADIFLVQGQENIQDLGENKSIININDYKDNLKYLPRVLNEGYNTEKLQAPNGDLYVMPNGNFSDTSGTQWNWVYRFDIFQKNNIKIPENLEELYQASKKLKELYPESYPMGASTGASWYSPAMVLFNLEKTNQKIYYNGEKYVFGPIEDQEKIKSVLMYLNKFYEEGLLEPEYLTQTWDQCSERMVNGRNFFVPNYWGGEVRKLNDVEGSTAVWGNAIRPKNFENQVGWKPGSAEKGLYVSTGDGMVISSEAKNPELLVKMMDYFYSDEMIELLSFGIEGETFKREDNGKITILPSITEAENPIAEKDKYGIGNLGACRAMLVNYKNTWAVDSQIFGKNPAYADGEFMEINHLDLTNDYSTSESVTPVAPPIKLTTEDNDLKVNVMTPIDTYVEECFDKFILGEMSFDEWNDFIDLVKEMGDYQAVLDMMNNKLEALKK